jgi:hypothetical protein
MGRHTLVFNMGYLILVVLLVVLVLSDVLWEGEPLTRSSGLGVAIFFAAGIPMCVLRIWQNLRPTDIAGLRDANATVTLRESTTERSCVILLSLGMMAMGALPLLGFPGPDVPAVLFAVILVIGSYSMFNGIIKPRARLTISPAGLDWSQIRPSFVPWSDITGSKMQRWLGFGSLAVFELKEAGKYFPRTIRKRTCQRFGVISASLGVDAETLVEGVEAHRVPGVFHSPASR